MRVLLFCIALTLGAGATNRGIIQSIHAKTGHQHTLSFSRFWLGLSDFDNGVRFENRRAVHYTMLFR